MDNLIEQKKEELENVKEPITEEEKKEEKKKKKKEKQMIADKMQKFKKYKELAIKPG